MIEHSISENRKQLLRSEHNNIASRIIVGPSIGRNDSISIVKMEEPKETLETVYDTKTLILTGSSRIGKTSLGNLAMSLHKRSGGKVFHFNCESISADDNGEENILWAADHQDIQAHDYKTLLAVLRAENYLIFIDELTLVIDPHKDSPIKTSALFLQKFIQLLQEKTIPQMIVIHEIPTIQSEVEKNWPFLAQSAKKFPRRLTEDEIIITGKHGNIYKANEPPIQPNIYKGLDDKTVREIVRIFGRWPVVVNEVIQKFSNKQDSIYNFDPAEKLNIPILHKAVKEYLWYGMLKSNQIVSLPKRVLRNLEQINKLDEFINAFELPVRVPDNLTHYDGSHKPLSAKKTDLCKETIQLLKNMKIVYEENEKIIVDGLLFSTLINNECLKI